MASFMESLINTSFNPDKKLFTAEPQRAQSFCFFAFRGDGEKQNDSTLRVLNTPMGFFPPKNGWPNKSFQLKATLSLQKFRMP